jgi:hypothetical protein
MNRLLIIAMAFALMMSVAASHAALGWTLDESIRNYGQPVTGPLPDEIGIGSTFSKPKPVRLARFTLMARSPASFTPRRKL